MIVPAPSFLKKMNLSYGARAGNIFLLHGNVHDLFFALDERWVPLVSLLVQECAAPDRMLLHLDLSSGLTILHPDSHTAFNFLSELFKRQKDVFEKLYKESATSVFAMLTLAKDITARIQQSSYDRKLVFIMSEINTVAPAQSEAHLSENDRRCIQFLQKWCTSEDFFNSRHALIMISESVEAVNAAIKNLPHITPIKIPRPDAALRKVFLVHYTEDMLKSGVAASTDELTEATAGLTLYDIRQFLRTAAFRTDTEKGDPPALTRDAAHERAREILEQSIGGYVEFVESDYGFQRIVGQKRLVAHLKRLAALFRSGNTAAIPHGILVPGPNGSGKSFIMKAFAKETGWHVVRLKNLRSMWYGETERIWEIIEEIIEAIGRVIIMVDEGDTELGGRGREVHEVDKRLFGKILRMMEDKRNKGRVCWILITARPDKLESDIKRSGRAGRHYPVFAPETPEEREAFVDHVLLEHFSLAIEGEQKKEVLELTESYYPADFDLLIEQLEEAKTSAGMEKLNPEILLEEVRVFHPADPVVQRKLQILVALMECTDERLIPDTDICKQLFWDREELMRQIMRLKQLSGESV